MLFIVIYCVLELKELEDEHLYYAVIYLCKIYIYKTLDVI